MKTLSIPVSCRFFIGKIDEILRTLLLMHDGISGSSAEKTDGADWHRPKDGVTPDPMLQWLVRRKD
jgi:hypothetical protein